MSSQTAGLKGLFACLLAALAAGAPGLAHGQALLVDRLPGGTWLVLVNQPLADATSIVWPDGAGDPDAEPARLIAGRLGLTADVEQALGTDDETTPAPPVIVAVGGAAADELGSLLARVLAGRPTAPAPPGGRPAMVEGGLDRRLGPPGSDAVLRLDIPLPPPGDRLRSAVEVLWELIPRQLADVVPTLRSRIEEPVGVLEGRIDADLAEVTLSNLRFELARFASDPTVDADDVAEVRRRLEVRRLASLEEHPEAAVRVLGRWLAGGEPAVRQYLFGLEAVTLEQVREAAAVWLPTHPGRASLVLPPRVFNPRFAVGPELVRMTNDLSAAILERDGARLAVVCLRPVMIPDLDGRVTATVLARIARELRSADPSPGFVRVRPTPPLIEIAGPADGFGELIEQLTAAYLAVAADDTPVDDVGGDARRRALDLMSGLLAVNVTGQPSPAELLRPGNLALGMVAADAEAAVEAVTKFWSVEVPATRSAQVIDVAAVPRTRAAAPGEESVVVVALDLAFGGNEAVADVVRGVIEERARRIWPEHRSAVLSPFVPGRALLLFELAADGSLDEVESALGAGWARLTAEVDETELAPVKRRVAASASAEMSGVAGHARRCAAVAAGAAAWHQPAEFELQVLTVEPDIVNAALAAFAVLAELETAGAGILPISELDRR